MSQKVPGRITYENEATFTSVFTLDPFMPLTSENCITCNVVRLPRSKHCPLCNSCCAKYDHHCVWLGNCIGFNNMGVFLIFLICHTLYLSYGVVVLTQLLYGTFKQHYLLEVSFPELVKKNFLPQLFYLALRYFFTHQQVLVFLWISSFIFSIVLFFFTAIHLYQVFIFQLTSRERFKLSFLKQENFIEYNRIRKSPRESFKVIFLQVFFPKYWIQMAFPPKQ